MLTTLRLDFKDLISDIECVHSRKCRGRLWRSEQEATMAEIDEDDVSAGPRDLRVRQGKRKPCACRSMRHRED